MVATTEKPDDGSSSASLRTGGDDAVAFTSGPQGAPFSAGVVHAWLAADRKRPLVAAGISMGTFAAAAMRRVYEELEHVDGDDLEVKRWRWYQRYHQAVTDNPLRPLWNAVPDPVDFFSESPPARDLSVPSSLRNDFENSRRHFYLLTRLGVWLAGLPVRLSTIATLIVMYVRRTESYGLKIFTWLNFYVSLFSASIGILFHLIASPQWIAESAFISHPRRRGARPLFGWALYLIAIAVLLGMPLLVALFLWAFQAALASVGLRPVLRLLVIVVACCGVFWGFDHLAYSAFASSGKPKTTSESNRRSWLVKQLLRLVSRDLDITRGLLHPYEIRRAIYDLFFKGAPDHVLHGPAPDAVKALFVCAALEETDQVVLSEQMPVVDALTASVAVPGLLPPQSVSKKLIVTTTITRPEIFQIIDGASVRTNPIPAFFDWCKHVADPNAVKRLERNDGKTPSLHVVYNVPTSYNGSVQEAPAMNCPDIVLSAQQALQLAKRRDTRQEVRQTNNVSLLEWHRRQLAPSEGKAIFAIQADEIAPTEEINLGNEVTPNCEKLRSTVASGCRRTLEVLYREEIHQLCGDTRQIPCSQLLRRIAPRRAAVIEKRCGLASVCSRCTGLLQYRKAENPNESQEGVFRTYGQPEAPKETSELPDMFPQLVKEEPKIVFLGSGGVFRGAFHIGVLAALHQTQLYPDLVVGASVGTLMGGALCRITAGEPAQAYEVLSDLVKLFTHVDTRVALTVPLKDAAKQLGIRARGVRLSPSELARKVKLGSKADPGYAATGAPPVLTDALSSLFTIPNKNTAAIASEFVAGHFSQAIARFLHEIRLETLTSLNIQNCIMGISLLEDETRRLLSYTGRGMELARVQPYQAETPSGRKVAFFGTTSFLNASTPLLLGRDFLTTSPTWSATQGGLCSSAFPAVFAPRTEADLMPGAGRTDRFFADGGMFDNLPFFPAIEILSEFQRTVPYADASELAKSLQRRTSNPNLIISAGLNEKPQPDEHVRADTISDINSRAKTLAYESKTNTFITSAVKSLSVLQEIGRRDLSGMNKDQLDFLNGFITASVVEITPTDAAHINPTFAFCKSLGLRTRRVQASIGDGCYRTILKFSESDAVQQQLQRHDRTLTRIRTDERPMKMPTDACPYFRISGKLFSCPFTQTQDSDAQGVYEICKKDPAHP